MAALTQSQALALTLVVELPLAAAAAVHLRQRSALARTLLAGAVASLITHPPAWALQEWLAWRLSRSQAWTGWCLVESMVAAVEAVVYVGVGGFHWPLAVVVSLLANGASAAAGLLLMATWARP